MRTDKLSTRTVSRERSVFTSLQFALGIGCAMVIAVLAWLLSSATGLSYSRAELLNLLPSMMSLVVATISLYVSYHALNEQQRARQAATDPVILVHLGKREDSPMMIMLYVSNVGAGAARNVVLKFNHNLVKSLIENRKLFKEFDKAGAQIKVIPQDSRVGFPMHVANVLVAEPRLPELFIDVTYEDIDGHSYGSTQSIDITELEGQDFSKSPIAKIAEEIEKIKRAVEEVASDRHKFRVLTQTLDESRREEQERIESIRSQRQSEDQQ